MNRRKLKFAAKILFGLAYALAFCEIFVRVLSPVAIVPRHVTAGPHGIRANEPNQSFWQTSSEYAIQIRTNSKGLRADEEIPYDKPPGVKRIVVLGDSFGMGFEVNLQDTFLEQMRRDLAAAGVNAQVINLSVSGFGTAEELIALRTEGLKYHPDLVLLAWHISDLDDNVRSGLFSLQNGSLVQTSDRYLPGIRMQQLLSRVKPYEWVSDHSQFFNFMREWASEDVIKPALVALRGSPRPGEASDAASANERSTADAAAPKAALALALLKKVQDTAAAANANFLILDVPMCEDRYHYKPAFPSDEMGRAFGFPVVDPIPDFMKHSGEKLYFETSHRHFTPAGCRIVGDLLARTILQRGSLNRPPS